jgi:hypothetical protein
LSHNQFGTERFSTEEPDRINGTSPRDSP